MPSSFRARRSSRAPVRFVMAVPSRPRPCRAPLPVVRYHDIAYAVPASGRLRHPARFNFKPCPPRLARNARTYQITLPDGTILRRTTSDPGRGLLTGVVIPTAPLTDDWGKFDVPGLRGISRTAPYFHNNSADNLEEVVDHYVEFFKRVPTVAPPGVDPAGHHHRRRQHGPCAEARGSGTAAGVPAKAVALPPTAPRCRRLASDGACWQSA